MTSSNDETEFLRRRMIRNGEVQANLAAALSQDETWDTAELQRDFEVLQFQAPLVVVRRRSDGQLGSLEFTPSPRVYFSWRGAD
jgi:hypothetical protein